MRDRAGSAYDNTQLSFNAGDVIYVTSKHTNGEWEGMCRGRSGFFPATFVAPKMADEGEDGRGQGGAEDGGEGQSDAAWEGGGTHGSQEVIAAYDDLENVQQHRGGGGGAMPPAFDDPFVASSSH